MSTLSPAFDNSSPFDSWSFEHAAIRVPDFDAAVAWYSKILNLQLTMSSPLKGKTYGFMSGAAPGFSIELIAGAGADDRPAYEDLGGSLKLSGLHHLAFRVRNVDEIIAELKRRGARIVSEPHDVRGLGLRVAFFADPWGNLFETIQAESPKTNAASNGSAKPIE